MHFNHDTSQVLAIGLSYIVDMYTNIINQKGQKVTKTTKVSSQVRVLHHEQWMSIALYPGQTFTS